MNKSKIGHLRAATDKNRSDDTKRMDWLEVLTDLKWTMICNLSDSKHTLRQTIDAAMQPVQKK